MKRQTPESGVLKQVSDYLLARRILHFRMQTGAHVASYRGRQRLIRYGTPGMADILAFTRKGPVWVEVKSAAGQQSPDQAGFEKIVTDEGHEYVLARSYLDVEARLRSMGAIR